jgi:phosphoribosylaminoimidazole carboxylase PurE protein
MKVGIVMGSKSDLPVMRHTSDVLSNLDIEHKMIVLSAHRTPDETAKWAKSAQSDGYGVIICGAGMAAHLAGAVAAHTLLPVIGVPVGSSLLGIDSLLSTVQMPPGVPVATVGVGAAGAKNAAWLAAEIVALKSDYVRIRLVEARDAMRKKVLEALEV